ncbi:MAG TPA: diguanylate cyclase [Anaeromyxobacter sp.]|nr:diguanylate cyclase [Anaeromyxobacter sp.]
MTPRPLGRPARDPAAEVAARAPGGPASVQQRLARQRPRPALVRLYAAVASDVGFLGPPARRRGVRFVLRAVPSAVTVAAGTLVALRAFEAPELRWPQWAVVAALALTILAAVRRRLARAAGGAPPRTRDELEIGALFLVSAYAAAQAVAPAGGESPLQPGVYLVVAFLVAFFAPAVGAAVAAEAIALEGLLWAARGAAPLELPDVGVRAGFVVAFALLFHAVLAAQIASGRHERRAAMERRFEELARAARQFRLRAAGSDEPEDPAERERRWTEGAVAEIQAAVAGALEVAGAALRSHTCALYWLSDDEQSLTLTDCRSASETVARGPLPAGEGALGGAVRRRAAVRLQGELKPVNYYLDATRPAALLAVPLVERPSTPGRPGAGPTLRTNGGEVRGVLVVDRLSGPPFGDDDEALLRTVGAEVLRAVDAERLMRDVRETRAQADRFYQAIQRLNRAKKLAEVLDELIGVARQMVPADLAAVVLVDEDAPGRARVARVVAAPELKAAGRLEGLEFDAGEGIVGSAMARDATLPLAEVDPARTPVFGTTSLRGLASLKVIPVKAGTAVLGALVLGARQRGAYAREVVLQLEVVAMQAGQSIERARLFDRTERLATTDGLTGLTNHRTMQERLEEHLALAQRYGKRVSLLLCDVDHFKSVNDTYGHPVGDEVLRAVARTLVKEARGTDVVARYGGEEFAIVMSETDTAGATVIAERIRECVARLVHQTPQGPLRVTISLGTATFPDDAKTKAELIERTDGCLYHAKRHGRNQTVAAASLRAPRRLTGSS